MTFSEINEKGIGRYINLEKYGLTTFSLKIIAMVTMLIDHFAVLFCNDNETIYNILKGIGRLSFPILCFVLAEGFFYTKNRLHYAIRLGAFALISEIPYNMIYGTFLNIEKQNIIFTLFIGFLTIWSLNSVSIFKINYSKKILKHISAGRLNTIIELIAMVAGLGMAYLLKTAYSYAGVMLIICFYIFRTHHIGRLLFNMVFNMGMFGLGIQWLGALSALPIAFYNGKPGIKRGKYFFYWFYPLHLTVLIVLKKYI